MLANDILVSHQRTPPPCPSLKGKGTPCPGGGQWDEAQFVDDQQAETGKPPLQVEKPSLVPGLH